MEHSARARVGKARWGLPWFCALLLAFIVTSAGASGGPLDAVGASGTATELTHARVEASASSQLVNEPLDPDLPSDAPDWAAPKGMATVGGGVGGAPVREGSTEARRWLPASPRGPPR